MKSETFHEPSQETKRNANAFFDEQTMGSEGPIQVGFPKEYSASHKPWNSTLNSLGVKTNPKPLSGTNVGVWTNICSVDPRTGGRSYSANAYYSPVASRSNLVILTGAEVKKILLSQENGEWVAKGVCFAHDDEIFEVFASKETILSAGSIQSPQILELSGIGGAEILNRAGISVKIDNPNVGENLQDHLSKSLLACNEASLNYV
jgi:choline dehydrogenase-like flavoprotein